MSQDDTCSQYLRNVCSAQRPTLRRHRYKKNRLTHGGGKLNGCRNNGHLLSLGVPPDPCNNDTPGFPYATDVNIDAV